LLILKHRQVCDAIGPEKAAAIAALHGLSGSYKTGSLTGKGKHSSQNAFQAANDSTLTALASIGTTIEFSDICSS